MTPDQSLRDTKQTIEKSFARQTMMATLGAAPVMVDRGKIVISAPFADTMLQQHGFAHAAVSFALGDSPSGRGRHAGHHGAFAGPAVIPLRDIPGR